MFYFVHGSACPVQMQETETHILYQDGSFSQFVNAGSRSNHVNVGSPCNNLLSPSSDPVWPITSVSVMCSSTTYFICKYCLIQVLCLCILDYSPHNMVCKCWWIKRFGIFGTAQLHFPFVREEQFTLLLECFHATCAIVSKDSTTPMKKP